MLRSWVRGGAAAMLVVGLAAPGGARAEAPAVTSEAATALTDTLDIGLRQWLPSAGAKAGWHWAGRPLVTPASDHFDVDLPSLTINGDDGSSLQAGVIKLVLTPQADGSWQVGATFPGRIAVLTPDGKPDGDVTIGTQHFTGHWLPALNTFVNLDAGLGSVRAVSQKDPTRLELTSLGVHTDLSEQPPGRWSGPGTLTLSGLTMVDEHGVEVARIGNIALDATVAGLDLARLVKAGASVDAARHPELLRDLLAGITAKLTVGDTTMTAATDHSSFTVKEVAVHGGLEGLDGEQSSIAVGYRHAGLALPQSPESQRFVPEKAEMDFAVTSLPNAGLWAAVEALLKPTPGKTDQQLGEQFSQAVMTALTNAGSQLTIKALSLDTPAAAATLKGNATFDGKAAFSVVASINTVLRGLDGLIKDMQPAPGAKPDPEAQKTLATATLVQALGAPGTDESGRDTRTYKLELGPDGKITLNGADMSAVLQSVQGGRGGPAPKP